MTLPSPRPPLQKLYRAYRIHTFTALDKKSGGTHRLGLFHLCWGDDLVQ